MPASGELSGTATDGANTASHRVIADHLRASGFLIADGVLPSAEGRGYVLRRIMRRAMRHAQILGTPAPLMHRLVPALVSQMGRRLPRTRPCPAADRGDIAAGGDALPRHAGERPAPARRGDRDDDARGHTARRDRVQALRHVRLPLRPDGGRAARAGFGVDRAGFDTAMAEQKRQARAAWAGSGQSASEAVWFDIAEAEGATEFVGYSPGTAQGRVVAIVRDGARVDSAGAGDTVAVVTNQTPFYAESGGQQGDAGTITGDAGLTIAVADTAKPLGKLHVHLGTVGSGTLRVGDTVTLAIDAERRDRLRANHSATHLLHAALRRRLGGHVTQKGLAGRARPPALRLQPAEGAGRPTTSPRSRPR